MANLTLSIILAIMASMSTLMLGIGQRSPILPALTLLAVTNSVIFTDKLGWFRLNRFVANLAMLVAAFFSLYGFMEAGSERQLMAIANLLVYVQLVLLFQEKNRRVYGQLAMFSLLQVVVAALLSHGLEFGALLVLYAVVALWGSVLFYIHREVEQVGVVPRTRFGWFAPSRSRRHAARGDDAAAAIEVLEQGQALNRAIVTRRLAAPVSSLVLATLVFAPVFFYIVPRTGGANWQRGMSGQRLVGFSPEVSLKEMGQLLQNDQRVMRVSFSNARSGEPYTVIGHPYLRGGILALYSSTDHRWQQGLGSSQPPRTLNSPPDARDLVRQDVLLEPAGNRLLFSLCPAYAISDTPHDLRIDANTHHLLRSAASDRELNAEYRYSIVTTAFRFGAQLPVLPHPEKLVTATDRQEFELAKQWLRHIDHPEAFPQLIALADSIVQERAPQGNNYDRARALEAHFLNTEMYRYTLALTEIAPLRRPGVDPIEDFVANHHSGHCEYFASALTLMLRSQGIPARLAIGYRPHEFNFVGNYFVVRQRDAHAWVEAYLEPHEIPQGVLYAEEEHAAGGWLRLDPTPSADENQGRGRVGLFDRASNSLDYARWLWNDYVSRLTEERQKRAILNPLALDRRLPLAGLLDGDFWRVMAEQARSGNWRVLLAYRFNWRAGLAAVLAGAVIWLATRALRALGPRLRRRSRQTRSGPRHAPVVAFYRQLEKTLARQGLRRSASQTQRQFAEAAARHLAASPPHADLAPIPARIVDAFYQVRFGHRLPDATQEAEIRLQLRQLEQGLAN